MDLLLPTMPDLLTFWKSSGFFRSSETPLQDLRKHSNMWSLKEIFGEDGHGVVKVVEILEIQLWWRLWCYGKDVGGDILMMTVVF